MPHPRRLCFKDRTRGRSFEMYRIIVALLCISTAKSAPQDSSVTFVKIQPFITDEILNTTQTDTQPLTINPTQSSEDSPSIQVNTFENNDVVSHDDDVTTELERTTTEIPEVTTEYEVTTTKQPTTKYPKPKIKQSPRFLSKLSHFKKANLINTSTNSINSFVKSERPYKRKFKSRCRCEKIENCPKLQITVPRCPNEYFLCCF